MGGRTAGLSKKGAGLPVKTFENCHKRIHLLGTAQVHLYPKRYHTNVDPFIDKWQVILVSQVICHPSFDHIFNNCCVAKLWHWIIKIEAKKLGDSIPKLGLGILDWLVNQTHLTSILILSPSYWVIILNGIINGPVKVNPNPDFSPRNMWGLSADLSSPYWKLLIQVPRMQGICAFCHSYPKECEAKVKDGGNF